MRTHCALTRKLLYVADKKSVVSAHSGRSIFFSTLFLLLLNTCLQGQDITIFQPADGSSALRFNDGLGIEAGMKFRSAQNGYIKGIRYYKQAGTTGLHTGHLWDNSGAKLAEAAFVNETASGWQEVLFGSAVAITANITYIAAYHSESGDYTATNSFFTQAVTSGPVYALADGEDGPNGVYTYTSSSAFPANPGQSANYWVDIIFTTTNAPDIIPPSVSFVSPLNGEANVVYNRNISAIFNEKIDPASVTSASFEVRDATGHTIPGTLIASDNGIVFDPVSPFTYSTVYTATVKGGISGIKDMAGNAMTDDYSWSFTVADLPAPEGNGGPILVISTIVNPFSRYTTEILKAQGLNEFIAKDILQVTQQELADYDVIILGEMNISSFQATMLSNWVNAGGTLISFRPAPELSSLFGITKMPGILEDKYLLVDTSSSTGRGIVGETMQFHSAADLYALNGASSLAVLYADAVTSTSYPAITIRAVGSQGGKAVAFAYDLPRSIVYTRQGNPLWSGQKRDGTTGPVRSDDMFFGLNGSHWIDFNKIAIPQADEQQHLLTNIILQSNLHRKPLPRFWFLPSGHKAAIVMTGDDHSFNGTTGQFNHFKTLGPNSPEDVANWKAIRATSYIYNGTMTNAQAAAFAAEGFEIALHVNTNCQDFTPFLYQDIISQQMAAFVGQLPNVPRSVTNRNHCVAWSDWSTVAKIESGFGIRLDVNYYYWPDTWVQNRPGMFTGSGMPMRFADLDGSSIDCYQVTTQMSDEANIDYAPFSAALLNKALGAEGYYGVFCANMHTDLSDHPGANAIIAEAVSRNVPVISAQQLLTWLDGRNGSSFGPMSWNNNQLSFTITALPGALNLQTMLPFHSETGDLISITRDGETIPFERKIIKGMEYAFFDVAVGTGSFIATYFAQNSMPVVIIHPLPHEVCAGDIVKFTSAATGNPLPTIHWETSANGIEWEAIAGATDDTLSFVATESNHKKVYRAVWTNNKGFANSDSALLVVHPLPVLTSPVTATTASGVLFDYIPSSSLAGTSFTWTREPVAGISNPASSGTGTVHEVLMNTSNSGVYVIYLYTLTSGNCRNTQKVTLLVRPAEINESCTSNSGIIASFNSISIRAGRHIWFNSVFDPSSMGNGPVNFTVTNGKITFTANGQNYSLVVPDATIQFSNTIQTPVTQYGTGGWKTLVPLSTSGNVFLSGLSFAVPANFQGNIRNVRWTANISIDKPGVSLNWKWAAAVYTNFASNAGLVIKPVDGPLQLLNTNLTDKAGTPVNYKLYVIPGATGGGLLGGLLNVNLLNYTGDYSNAVAVACEAAKTGEHLVTAHFSKGETLAITSSTFDAKVMPNPSTFSFMLRISGSNESPVTIRIFDALGQVIEQYQKTGNTTMELGATWKGGTYIAELSQDGQRKILKLVKIN